MSTTTPDAATIHDAVRAHYAARATAGGCGCGPAAPGSSACCTPAGTTDAAEAEAGSCGCGPAPADGSACCTPSTDAGKAAAMGYTARQVASIPAGANLGLGCGNPIAAAGLQPGETVLDLGSGAGIDCFLAAQAVGPAGRAIGVDMTHEMLAKARANAAGGGYRNVEFRLGQIEHLPLGDSSVDVVISNCVVNLSPDKPGVWREAFRVLRPGGRIAISDVVATAELPHSWRQDLGLLASCAAGAEPVGKIESDLRAAGFSDVRVVPKDSSRAMIREWAPGRRMEEYLVSAHILARKPA